MNTFRVIKEQTHKFDKRGRIYIILFKDGDKFGIDGSSDSKGLGRITLSTREQAEYVFEGINSEIEQELDFFSGAQKTLSMLESESFVEIVLRIHTDGRTIGKTEIMALCFMLGLSKDEKESTIHSIVVREKSKEDSIGEFASRIGEDQYSFYFYY